jgi:hypothetical protein
MGGFLGPATAVEELLWTVGLKVTVRCGFEGGFECDWRLGLGMRGVDSVDAIVDCGLWIVDCGLLCNRLSCYYRLLVGPVRVCVLDLRSISISNNCMADWTCVVDKVRLQCNAIYVKASQLELPMTKAKTCMKDDSFPGIHLL